MFTESVSEGLRRPVRPSLVVASVGVEDGCVGGTVAEEDGDEVVEPVVKSHPARPRRLRPWSGPATNVPSDSPAGGRQTKSGRKGHSVLSLRTAYKGRPESKGGLGSSVTHRTTTVEPVGGGRREVGDGTAVRDGLPLPERHVCQRSGTSRTRRELPRPWSSSAHETHRRPKRGTEWRSRRVSETGVATSGAIHPSAVVLPDPTLSVTRRGRDRSLPPLRGPVSVTPEKHVE